MACGLAVFGNLQYCNDKLRKGTFDFALYQVEQITAIAVTKCQIQFLNEDILRDSKYMFFCKHSVFQCEARICLTFSQIQPQNMLI